MFYGWYVVGGAFLVAVWAWGLAFYGLGIYLVALSREHGWSISTVSIAITTYYLMGAAVTATIGHVMRRLGPHRTVVAGVIAMAAGVASLGAIDQLWQLYLALASMAVGWAAMSGAAINILLAPWFERRRGVAVSLALTGASGGGIIVAPVLLILIARSGLQADTPARRRGDGSHTRACRGRRVPPDAGAARSRTRWRSGTIRRSGSGAGSAAGVAVRRAPDAALLDHLRRVRGWPRGSGRRADSPGISPDALARSGRRGQRPRHHDGRRHRGPGTRWEPWPTAWTGRPIAAINFLLQVAGIALLALASSSIVIYVGCVLFGLGVGNVITLPGLLVEQEFPRGQFAGIVSLITATNQLAFAFAPGLIGLLRDATGSYGLALVLCAVVDLVAAVVVLGLARKSRPRRNAAASGLALRPNCDCDLPPDSPDAPARLRTSPGRASV